MILEERMRERDKGREMLKWEHNCLKIWYEINALELEKNKNGQLYVHPNI